MSKVAMESSSRINTTGSKYTVATGTGAVPSTSTSKRSRKAALGGDEFMAAAIGDTAWLRQTLKEGKNPANFDKNGLSAIHLAALHGRMECLKLLVEKYHVSVNLASTTGWRPIHLCINSRTGKRALECLQYLLDAGADPSAPNEDLMTPTHQAAIEGSVKCMAALLAGGGDISTPDCNGHLPLDYAKIWGHRKCARILASETWKREKEAELTKVTELQQLKNLKDAVDGWEEQDQQAYKTIQSEASFSEWMDKKGLADKQSPRLVSHKQESATTLGAMANQLYQANSPRKANVPAVKLQAATEKTTGKGKAAGSKGKTQTKSAAAPAKSPGAERGAPRERLCKGKTKPKLEPVPKVKVPTLEITGEQNEDKVKLYLQPVPDLSQEVIDRILLEKLSPHERPLSFKCKNIIDAQHRRLYDSSVKPLEEVYAHLSNDKSSTLFPGVTNSGSSASTRTSSTSDRDSFDNQRIADALKFIAKPYKFPQIQGEDFKYGFEVL